MKRKNAGMTKSVEKYYRWLRRYWYHAYLMRVRQTELEIGGELHAC